MSARKAALRVAELARDPKDCRLLLDALGLLPEPTRRKGRPKSPCGTSAAYKNGCRCEPCTRANTDQCTQWRDNCRGSAALADRAGHGRLYTYKNYGCRCAACKQANTEASRRYRASKRGRR
jgi:hypothetical protein